MPKRTTPTILEKATSAVPGFHSVIRKLEQQVALKNQSQSTLRNYSRKIAAFVLHFSDLPENIDQDQINAYLATLARDPKSPSRSTFKHMVYGLRYYYKLMGLDKRAIALEAINKDTKLPVIQIQCKRAFVDHAPSSLKGRDTQKS